MSAIRLSFIGLVARFFVLVVTLIASVIIARGTGPAGVGEYFLVITTASLIATFADWGLSSSAVVFSGDRRHRLWELGTALLAVAISISIPIGLAARSLFPLPSVWGNTAFGATAAVLISPIILFNNYWTALLVGRKEISVANAFQCVTYVVFTLILIVLHISGRMTVRHVIISHVVCFGAQMVAQVVLMFLWRERDDALPASTRTALIAQMIRFGLPVYPSMVATIFSLRIGILMLAAMHGTYASGIYSVAFQLADKILLIARSIQDAIYETVIRLTGREAVETLNRYLRSATVVFVCVAIAGLLAAPLVVRLFYGNEFIASIAPLQLLIVGCAMCSMAVLISTYFVGQVRRLGLLSWLACISAIIAVIASRLLIPILGPNGAALAFLMTQASVLGLSLLAYRWHSRSTLSSVLVLSKSDVLAIRRGLSARLSNRRKAAPS